MNGKGSARRGQDADSQARYAAGWDRVFGSKKLTKKTRSPALEYPGWICGDCGTRLGRGTGFYATWHLDRCGWCKREACCTEPRDFGYPQFPG